MGKGFKERTAFEVTVILLALAAFCLITRLWPLVFLVIPGILIAALRLLFLPAKKGTPEPAYIPPVPMRSDTEQDVIRIAFGVLQRRITEQVVSRYPAARWVWETPNAMDRFADGLPLTVILSRAGGFRKAAVHTRRLLFIGLSYESPDTDGTPEPPAETDSYREPDGYGDGSHDGEAVDYALIAFQWAEANMLELNSLSNDAIAAGNTDMLIPAAKLPHPDSWQSVCGELTRGGFPEASAGDGGITVTLPK